MRKKPERKHQPSFFSSSGIILQSQWHLIHKFELPISWAERCPKDCSGKKWRTFFLLHILLCGQTFLSLHYLHSNFFQLVNIMAHFSEQIISEAKILKIRLIYCVLILFSGAFNSRSRFYKKIIFELVHLFCF